MLSSLILAAAVAAASPCPTAPGTDLLSLSYDAFDTSSTEHAWRSLLGQGCVDSAVATLTAYRHANAAHMTAEQRNELTFHIGQALAMAGREKESIEHFKKSAAAGSTPEWSAYVAANLGFVRKDRAQVEQALAAYEKIANPGSMRLGVIRGFLRCLDKSYMEAAHCGM